MLNRTVAKIVFYLVVIVLLVWTASLTVSFLQSVLPNSFWAIPYLGLVIFDGGMIAWMFVFLSHAQGAIQRAVSLMLTVVNLIGVGLMVVAEIMLDGQQWVQAPETLATVAVWAVGIWTIINVAGVVLFHLGDNNARKEMRIQSEKDAVWDGALDNLSKKRVGIQAELTDQLSNHMLAEMIAALNADKDGNGRLDIFERGAQSGPRTVDPPPPAQLTDAQARQILALMQQSNSTHDTPRQGDKPNGPGTKPLGADPQDFR